jgi:hypothetical protein
MNRRAFLTGLGALGLSACATLPKPVTDDTELVVRRMRVVFEMTRGCPKGGCTYVVHNQRFKWKPVERVLRGYWANGHNLEVDFEGCTVDMSGTGMSANAVTGRKREVELDY